MSLDKISPKRKSGVIGHEKRFKLSSFKTPGPGEYQTEMYKSLSKGDISLMAAANIVNSSNSKVSSPRGTAIGFSMSVLRVSSNN